MKSLISIFAPYKLVYLVLSAVWFFVFSVSLFTGRHIFGGLQHSLLVVLAGMMISLTIVVFVFFCVYKFMHIACSERNKAPFEELGFRLKRYVVTPAVVQDSLNIAVILFLLATAFIFLKSVIPILNPFSWDQAFMEIDRLLFWGVHPWEVLHPFLGYPIVTFLINVIYYFWVPTLLAFYLLLIFLANHHSLRLQYLVATVLVWFIGGNLLATLFSTAGPCYFASVGLAHEPYAGLMAYLRGVNEIYPIWALQLQDLLWQTFGQPQNSFNLISAMPSMHVGTSVLFALLAWRLNVWFGWVMTGFAMLIFLGSIHLGWHYAVDGLVALLITLPLWLFSGILVWRFK